MIFLAGMTFGQGHVGGTPKASMSGPVLIYRVTAEYTEEARMAKIEGTVRIDLVIDEKGIPADLKLVRSLDKGLDAKALEAVKRWRFKPGLKDGNPVSSTATVGIVFRLPESRSN